MLVFSVFAVGIRDDIRSGGTDGALLAGDFSEGGLHGGGREPDGKVDEGGIQLRTVTAEAEGAHDALHLIERGALHP